MAEPLPAALKIPEVSRFVNRANQLRAIKPAIAYWCEYHAVNQIVSRGLQKADDGAYEYTTSLIDRLEATKAERADDDAIHDNTAGQAFVEQFAQETFARAERTMTASKVTRQTADTFDAAATFFDLTRVWDDPSPETLQKIKFAKWNAARILKAIRDGKDPNESNPKPQSENDEIDAEVEAIAAEVAAETAAEVAAHSQQATVEDVSEAGEPSGASAPPDDYFPPAAPSAHAGAPASHEAATPFSPSAPSPSVSSQFPPQPSPLLPPHLLPQNQAAPSPQPLNHQPPTPSWGAAAPSPSIPPNTASYPPPPMPPPAQTPTYAAAAPAVAPPAARNTMPLTAASQREINEAQKHAKWAISALNFDDLPTAINELRNALSLLGGL